MFAIVQVSGAHGVNAFIQFRDLDLDIFVGEVLLRAPKEAIALV